MGDTYETHVEGIRILPGQWRPHYPWEHIAWISPSWPCQDYLWLDFPEGVISDAGFHFLSAMNPAIPEEEVLFTELPPVPWQRIDDGLAYEQALPGGVTCAARVVATSDSTIGMHLELTNTGSETLTAVEGRTCLFLRATRDFGQYGGDNKLAYLGKHGWVSHTDVYQHKRPGRYPIHSEETGVSSDVPVSVCVSALGERLVAMTWFENTLKLGGNPERPCLHADPKWPDLAPGETVGLDGEIIFFEGTADDFLEYWRQRFPEPRTLNPGP